MPDLLENEETVEKFLNEIIRSLFAALDGRMVLEMIILL
jgi:hypothetical protein